MLLAVLHHMTYMSCCSSDCISDSISCHLSSLFRFPNIACELLTCDVGVINDKLGNEEPLLETLYAFLEQPSPLNPLLASFFSKTIGNLITRKTEQVTR